MDTGKKRAHVNNSSKIVFFFLLFVSLQKSSHLHFDAHPGLLCGVEGTKRVRLWKPGAIQSDTDAPASWPLNVFFSGNLLSDLPPCDMTLELKKGDVLLIPFNWWHEVTSETGLMKTRKRENLKKKKPPPNLSSFSKFRSQRFNFGQFLVLSIEGGKLFSKCCGFILFYLFSFFLKGSSEKI